VSRSPQSGAYAPSPAQLQVETQAAQTGGGGAEVVGGALLASGTRIHITR
jgi:hypothetical protein